MRISKSGKPYGFKKGKIGYWKSKTFSKKHRENMSLAHSTPELKKQSSIICSKTMKGNNHYKDFLRKLTPENQRLWKKENGIKISLWYENNPEYVEKLRARMWGNVYVQEHLAKHPIWKKPDWNRYVPFRSVPEFIDIPKTPLSVIGQVNYFTQGTIGVGGLL